MINKILFGGHLGADPELRYTPNGQSVCNFQLASTEKWVDKQSGQKKEKTEWLRVTVFGKLAELCNQYLSKGKKALAVGKINTRQWEDKKGDKRYATGLIANEVFFLSPPDNLNEYGIKPQTRQLDNNQNDDYYDDDGNKYPF